ncbi:MAG: EamA family transporter [Thermodesulfovibrionales bacterium]
MEDAAYCKGAPGGSPGEVHGAGRLGYLCVLLAAFLWAASGSISKYLFLNGISPFQLVQLRTTLAAGALLIWLLARRRPLLAVKRRHFPFFLLLGIALAAAQFTYLFAISKIQVAAAILLQYQAPVLVVAFAVLFAGRRLTFSTAAALLGALIGCFLMVGAYRLEMMSLNRAGILSGLASAVTFALYSVKSEHGMRTYTPWTVVLYALLCAAFVWNTLHPPLEAFRHAHQGAVWGGILFVGIFGTVIPFGLYNEGIRRIRSTHASITATSEPVIAGVIAWLFLGERMEGWQLAGAGLVVASLLLLQMRQDPPDGSG